MPLLTFKILPAHIFPYPIFICSKNSVFKEQEYTGLFFLVFMPLTMPNHNYERDRMNTIALKSPKSSENSNIYHDLSWHQNGWVKIYYLKHHRWSRPPTKNTIFTRSIWWNKFTERRFIFDLTFLHNHLKLRSKLQHNRLWLYLYGPYKIVLFQCIWIFATDQNH